MNKTLLATALGACLLPALANGEAEQTKTNIKSGGATTVYDTSRNAFSLPAKNLSILRRDNFFIGNAFFKQPWVPTPASTKARDGLGPLFNTNTCQSCHVKDGRGHPPLEEGDDFLSTLIRLSIPATSDEHQALLKTQGAVAEPNYGDQLQPKANPGIKPEARPRFTYETINGQYKDGSTYQLIKPTLHLDNPAYGDFHPDLMTSARVAPVMIGLGLIDAIAEADILANADPDDKDGDGISGRANYVWDIEKQKTVLGRFGLKANQPNIAQQVKSAFHGDMGLTSSMHKQQGCTAVQTDCQKAVHGGTPEVEDKVMDKVVFYSSTLGVPARRNATNPEVIKGEQLFTAANCNSCHQVSFKTADYPAIKELSKQTIMPYSDLLLHDMGEGLADGRPDFLATGREWRTPPLWGIGLVETVNQHTRFLHDGRARNLSEAILWHGGEAEASKQAFVDMSKADRDALIAFLNSL
ncbi:di-heme oxidoredictase family protein [Leucothrix pacifica]|uniref:Thiol oxidoreductase n=1 Tax=Leucothrix pacifica TaxID=1247513 RepID=A0A317C1P6_9GAMM|nr:di-heme oxidoredictase family protein [Leucothrix pacifica]PWQ92554.1 thiol oxidoreductase [Leucothrix pacifica]